MCSGQLLASKNIAISIRGKKTPSFCADLVIYTFLTKKSAPPYTSLDLAYNLLSDWLWASPLYCLFQGTQISARSTYFFHHAQSDNYMCDSSRLFASRLKMTTTCVELHDFRGL